MASFRAAHILFHWSVLLWFFRRGDLCPWPMSAQSSKRFDLKVSDFQKHVVVQPSEYSFLGFSQKLPPDSALPPAPFPRKISALRSDLLWGQHLSSPSARLPAGLFSPTEMAAWAAIPLTFADSLASFLVQDGVRTPTG